MSKTEDACRLSGAHSVRTNPLRESVRPRNLLTVSFRAKAVNRLQSQDFHLIFNNAGASGQGSTTLTGRAIYPHNETLFRAGWPIFFGAGRHGSYEFIKDRLEVLLLAKPFRNLVPECEPRDPGLIRGFQNWMPRAPAKIHGTPRHTVTVLDFIVYIKTPCDAQGENKKS